MKGNNCRLWRHSGFTVKSLRIRRPHLCWYSRHDMPLCYLNRPSGECRWTYLGRLFGVTTRRLSWGRAEWIQWADIGSTHLVARSHHIRRMPVELQISNLRVAGSNPVVAAYGRVAQSGRAGLFHTTCRRTHSLGECRRNYSAPIPGSPSGFNSPPGGRPDGKRMSCPCGAGPDRSFFLCRQGQTDLTAGGMPVGLHWFACSIQARPIRTRCLAIPCPPDFEG